MIAVAADTPESNALVERAARAIYDANPWWADTGDRGGAHEWETASPDTQEWCRRAARAALSVVTAANLEEALTANPTG